MTRLNSLVLTIAGFLAVAVLLSALTVPYFRDAERQATPITRAPEAGRTA